jgi:F0F1-type ATP synthase beta subunit
MAVGKVVQVVGPVVDVEFPPESLPYILNAIEIPRDGQKLVVEVAQIAGQTLYHLKHHLEQGGVTSCAEQSLPASDP